ncbi:hypothetical protein PanWU01x14_166020 [Parasponia andersonii]|uniref:Uncharacterized protein n=1 Tax=Parasponia andersonii TaxID=3476 RepID=A0A2P5CC13_PARAD|nr:hypothetical protein PanWU01x14_166020 [Parasponia andersonii]
MSCQSPIWWREKALHTSGRGFCTLKLIVNINTEIKIIFQGNYTSIISYLKEITHEYLKPLPKTKNPPFSVSKLLIPDIAQGVGEESFKMETENQKLFLQMNFRTSTRWPFQPSPSEDMQVEMIN